MRAPGRGAGGGRDHLGNALRANCGKFEPQEPQHGKVRKHFRVNVSGITRALPRHLRVPFKQELERRLLARCGQHVTVEDVRIIAQNVPQRMRPQ
jgi:hypothetical protein